MFRHSCLALLINVLLLIDVNIEDVPQWVGVCFEGHYGLLAKSIYRLAGAVLTSESNEGMLKAEETRPEKMELRLWLAF
jgi:hypothetical protein